MRLIVQATIEIRSSTSEPLNHHEVKTWKTWSRSSNETNPGPSRPSYRSWMSAIWSE